MRTFPALVDPFPHADLDGRPRNPVAVVRPFPNLGDSPAERAAGALRKAWLSDDAGEAEQARVVRAEAAWFLRMAIRDGMGLNRHLSADLALLADLLRRSSDCAGAIAAAQRGLAAGPPEGVGSLLLFQLQLARAGDQERHHLGEALS